MRVLKDWRIEAVLLAFLGFPISALIAAEPSGDSVGRIGNPAHGGEGFAGWYGAKTKITSARPDKENKLKPPALQVVGDARALRTQAIEDYLRRLAVCDQLMQVAVDNRDEVLQRQVEGLKERVWKICQQRLAQIPTRTEALDAEKFPADKDQSAPKKGERRKDRDRSSPAREG